ncbi:Trypsin [Nannocystis exedens]|uniref:Trypsin n=1 Tax=Nannocystis exedens TaxID=54 RepID=A0A1I1WG88_9BACT|nr:trypsin-like serine protease [Nannocystis exedens]PCC67685.1 trypsin domain lipoprotein [Nannocystis exedens]SFD93999.1 Trypsin [Nannocystis exedens]
MVPVGLLVVLAAPRPVAAPERPPAPILGGTVVERGAWPEVVAMTYGPSICTGTLVSERVVLTAAHCIIDAGWLPISVRFGVDVTAPGTRVVAVERAGFHPDYCSDLKVCKWDVWDYGYLVLAEPVTDVAPARPLRGQEEWDEAMAIGGDVTLVGYGRDEASKTHVKRQVDVPIVRLSPTGLEFRTGGDGIDSCGGDSGGPAFVTLASGEVRLAGVTSRGSEPCGKGGYYGIPAAALCSYGFRPKRSATQALERLRVMGARGGNHVLDADIRDAGFT